jgi:hypothetical protein
MVHGGHIGSDREHARCGIQRVHELLAIVKGVLRVDSRYIPICRCIRSVGKRAPVRMAANLASRVASIRL